MSNCSICQKAVAVSLYLRVKPMFDSGNGKWRAGPKDVHKFFGYWPKDSHLAIYLKMEYDREMRGAPDPILQRLWEGNCHGHQFEEILAAIEDYMPPIPGVAIKVLWNPSPRVTPMLLAESPYDREQAQMKVNNDLRMVTIYRKEDVKVSLQNLLNNSVERIISSVSYPDAAIRSNGNVPRIHTL